MRGIVAFFWIFLVLSPASEGHEVTSQPPSGDDAIMTLLQQILENTSDQAETSGLGSVVSSLMEKVSSLELQAKDIVNDSQATKTKLQTLEAANTALEASNKVLEEEIQTMKAARENQQGSSFVRWGRKTCPSNSTLVYSGLAGGKGHERKGGGTNRLCLPRKPKFDNTPKPRHFGFLYGAEYEHIPGHREHDVPCSVCLTPLPTTIMVPATLTCPDGWTKQYSGHLTGAHYTHYATEYVCLDGSPEDDPNGAEDKNGALFYYVVTQCGSLPCPHYEHDKVVTCVVCSK